MRSTVRQVVYARGLNLVLLTVRVSPPWGGPPLALPVNARLHTKNDPTSTIEHAAAMIRELAGWFPDRDFHLRGQDPQSWTRHGPKRAAALSLWLFTLTWCWYLEAHPTRSHLDPRPWYPAKATPSFLDALAALRRDLWSPRINALSNPAADDNKITQALLDTLAYAA